MGPIPVALSVFILWMFGIAVITAGLVGIVLYFMKMVAEDRKRSEEWARCNRGDHIVSMELDPKKTEYTFEIPGFIKTLGLDTWYCSLDNIHKRCASIVFLVNTSVFVSTGKPFFSTIRITIRCIDGDQDFDAIYSRYVGSFNSRHYFITGEENLA